MLDNIIKYKYVITLVGFSIWMLFFDGNSALFMMKQYRELKDLRAQESFLAEEIKEMNNLKTDLFSNDDKLEQYARENYFFKRDDEDVFVVETQKD